MAMAGTGAGEGSGGALQGLVVSTVVGSMVLVLNRYARSKKGSSNAVEDAKRTAESARDENAGSSAEANAQRVPSPWYTPLPPGGPFRARSSGCSGGCPSSTTSASVSSASDGKGNGTRTKRPRQLAWDTEDSDDVDCGDGTNQSGTGNEAMRHGGSIGDGLVVTRGASCEDLRTLAEDDSKQPWVDASAAEVLRGQGEEVGSDAPSLAGVMRCFERQMGGPCSPSPGQGGSSAATYHVPGTCRCGAVRFRARVCCGSARSKSMKESAKVKVQGEEKDVDRACFLLAARGSSAATLARALAAGPEAAAAAARAMTKALQMSASSGGGASGEGSVAMAPPRRSHALIAVDVANFTVVSGFEQLESRDESSDDEAQREERRVHCAACGTFLASAPKACVEYARDRAGVSDGDLGESANDGDEVQRKKNVPALFVNAWCVREGAFRYPGGDDSGEEGGGDDAAHPKTIVCATFAFGSHPAAASLPCLGSGIEEEEEMEIDENALAAAALAAKARATPSAVCGLYGYATVREVEKKKKKHTSALDLAGKGGGGAKTKEARPPLSVRSSSSSSSSSSAGNERKPFTVQYYRSLSSTSTSWKGKEEKDKEREEVGEENVAAESRRVGDEGVVAREAEEKQSNEGVETAAAEPGDLGGGGGGVGPSTTTSLPPPCRALPLNFQLGLGKAAAAAVVAAKEKEEGEERRRREREEEERRRREREKEAWERGSSRRGGTKSRRLSVTLRNVGAEDFNASSISPLRVDYAADDYDDDDDDDLLDVSLHFISLFSSLFSFDDRPQSSFAAGAGGDVRADRNTTTTNNNNNKTKKHRKGCSYDDKTADRVRRLRAHLAKHLAV